MKMNYELKSSIHKEKFSLPLKIVSVIVLVLVILHLFVPTLLSNIFTVIAKPFWSIDKGVAVETQNAIITQLEKENQELKEILGRNETKDFVLAYILKKPPFTAYDSFVLDVGTKQGIKIGNKVYAMGNILIGDILEVSGSSSKVRLYSSYGTKYEIFIGKENIQAIALGRGGGTFETVIPRDVKVREGDIITIPDISNTVFGTVGTLITDPARAFSTVIFSQPLNIYEQKWVLISINKDND